MKPNIIFTPAELIVIISELAFTNGHISGIADVTELLGTSKMDTETLTNSMREQQERLQKILTKLNNKYAQSEQETLP